MMVEAKSIYANDLEQSDAFISLGIMSDSAQCWDKKIRLRLLALRSFQSNLERYAFLSDLKLSNRRLFDALLKQDYEMTLIFTEVDELLSTTVGN